MHRTTSFPKEGDLHSRFFANGDDSVNFGYMLKSLISAIVPAPWLSFYKQGRSSTRRHISLAIDHLRLPKNLFHNFVCNVCGEETSFPRAKMMRESPSCVHCGSSVRFRSIIHTLSMELFGESLAIKDFPERHDLKGAGMSDWDGYAKRLAQKLDYVNTYYHKEPLLDIGSKEALPERYDFIISTDVFEHVSQPISRAFHNVFSLLKPGGVFIFSVPCIDGETIEHFPELSKYSITKEKGVWILTNDTVDGKRQRYDNLVFHEGPGAIVEMRLFGSDSLVNNFSDAGFTQTLNHSEEVNKYGILWNKYVPEEAPYRPLILGLGAPPWSARKP
jgi:SAM-dependent methyltransferase